MKHTLEQLKNQMDEISNLAPALNPEVIKWVNAFATCAVEGNKPAQQMIDLWNSGKRQEFVRLVKERWL